MKNTRPEKLIVLNPTCLCPAPMRYFIVVPRRLRRRGTCPGARGPSSCGSRAEWLAEGHLVPRARSLGSESSPPKARGALIVRHDRRSRARRPPLRRRAPGPGVGYAHQDHRWTPPFLDRISSYCYRPTRGVPWHTLDLHYRHPFSARTPDVVNTAGFVN